MHICHNLAIESGFGFGFGLEPRPLPRDLRSILLESGLECFRDPRPCSRDHKTGFNNSTTISDEAPLRIKF